jgi:3-oxoacyl-[acyl-carrier-protein] synthase II
MDRLCGLALVACDGALLDGALAPAAPAWDGPRTAIVFGTAFGCHATNEEYYRGLLAGGVAGASPRLFAYTLPSSPAGEISIHYGIRGPASTVTPGLTAGAAAIAEGVRHLHSGRADRVLVAAAEVASPLLARLLGSTPLRDGGAALILERAGDARARGAAIRGWVIAVGAAHVKGQRADGVVRAARRALTAAALEPRSIGSVAA